MNLPKNKKIILFDGHCNLCDSSVQFLCKQDKHDVFRFVSLQSDLGKSILKHIGIDQQNIDSIVLYIPGIAYFVKSDAVLEITNDLNVLYQMLGVFKVFPLKMRDSIYDYIAKNRYKYFGKKENCMIPSPEFLKKFL